MVVYERPAVGHLCLSCDMLGKFAEFLVLEKQHSAASRRYGLVAVKTDGANSPECPGMPALII